MKKFFLINLILIFISGCSWFKSNGIGSYLCEMNDLENFALGEKFVIKIKVDGREMGSGFILDFNKKIGITCGHLFTGINFEKIEIVYKKRIYKAKLVQINIDLDIAILFIDALEGDDKIELSENVTKGCSAYFMGYPLGIPSIIKTQVSHFEKDRIYFPRTFTNGSSGGVVFQDGKVIGIIMGYFIRQPFGNTRSISFAIPSWVIKQEYVKYLKGVKNEK